MAVSEFITTENSLSIFIDLLSNHYQFQPQQKGKQGTKGAKQIVEENVTTLNFYRNMAIFSNALSLIILVFYNSTISIVSIMYL